jgi:predicted MPP superfamily phosphohydrolase
MEKLQSLRSALLTLFITALTSQVDALAVNNQCFMPVRQPSGFMAGMYSGDDTAYSFIVAGHAYGAHAGGNLGLHPALLNSLDSGFDSLAAFIVFTGDIVNSSTTASWQQVDAELSQYELPYYLVMGNHDNNDIGRQVFTEKFGGTYYAFHWQNDLFIVLNSPLTDRSISQEQLTFLEGQISQAGDTTRNIFIFFHEVLWNSQVKYAGVRSNSRSRYSQIVTYSNYWDEVHPMLVQHSDKQFYVCAGDVGGNTDAVAAFYDQWDNVTLLASGMGEVPDENYLLVRVHNPDSVAFELVALDPGLTLPGIEYYSVPAVPDSIEGPGEVVPGSTGVAYSVPAVFNATSYVWEMPAGLTGTGALNILMADVDSGFTGGVISVSAARDGFGTGPPVSKMITAHVTSVDIGRTGKGFMPFECYQADDHLVVRISGLDGEMGNISIFNILGKLLKQERISVRGDYYEWKIIKNELPEGLVFITVSVQNYRKTGKFIVY